MIVVAGLTDADPHAGFRRDMCHFADDRLSDAQKLAFMHEVLRRDVADVRMFLDHLERYAASLGPAQRHAPDAAAALAAIERDAPARERYLDFARDADRARRAGAHDGAGAQARLAVARGGAGRVHAHDRRSHGARTPRAGRGGPRLRRVNEHATAPGAAIAARGAGAAGNVAIRRCWRVSGSADGRAHRARALTSAQRRRRRDRAGLPAPPPDRRRGRGARRHVGIARMPLSDAQVRALDTLAQQRLADPESLHEIARLFPLARSLNVQRAIAGILIRSDYRMLARADLARVTAPAPAEVARRSDVIDALIRRLQSPSLPPRARRSGSRGSPARFPRACSSRTGRTARPARAADARRAG